MGSKQKLWEDMAPTEKLAAIRELAEQLKALRDDRAMRHEPDEAQPIQLRPSACLRRGDAFLLSTAIALDHSAILTCRNIPLGASAAPPNVTRFFILAMKNPAGKG